jgi:hypothetical protein
LAQALSDPKLQGYAVLQQLFFAPMETGQKAGKAFTDRLMQRGADREPILSPRPRWAPSVNGKNGLVSVSPISRAYVNQRSS